MSVDLVALTAASGLPIATRRVILQKGSALLNGDGPFNCGEIPLNAITTLYSLNLFSQLNGCNLQLAKTGDDRTKVRWKQFNDSIVLIVIANGIGLHEDTELDSLLELSFDAMVMMCGLAELGDSNVERLKSTVKQANPLVDYFLSSFATGRGSPRLELITHCSHYAIASRSSYIASLVNSVAQTASSSFCALYVHKKLLAASSDWWTQLNRQKDSFLISSLLDSMLDIGLIQTREMLIRLPGISPNNLTRLVINQITKGVVLCILCAEEPSLEFIESEILVPLNDLNLQEEKLSGYIYELRGSKYLSPMTFKDILGKDTATFVNQITAFLLVNYEHKVYLSFNEELIEEYFNELVIFTDLGTDKSLTTDCDAYHIGSQVNMYRVSRRHVLLCTFFPSTTTVKQMIQTNDLQKAFFKAKHFWPSF